MNKRTIQNAANLLQETMIIYFDEDTKESGFCSESEFDFLADTNQVGYSWIKEVINPAPFPMVAGEGAPTRRERTTRTLIKG